MLMSVNSAVLLSFMDMSSISVKASDNNQQMDGSGFLLVDGISKKRSGP